MSRLLAAAAASACAAFLPLATLALTATPDDPFFTQQWALHGSVASTDAPLEWCKATGAGVTVADVDTGADFSHPDLAGKLIRGASFQSGTGNPDGQPVDDGFGHGTMTTGIMVANTNNGHGIAGEAPSSRALIVKVLDSSGKGNEDDVAAGVQWAADHGGQVINVSIGPEIPLSGIATQLAGGDPLVNAIDYAAQHGKLVVLAAGNSSLPAGDYLGVDQEALVAGALGPQGEIPTYSNNGTGVNIYAPGGDGSTISTGIISTYIAQSGQEDRYAIEQGTSFATPYVAGVAALLVGAGETPLQARQRILDTATRGPSGVPQVNAQTALGSCPAGSAGHGTASGGSERPVGAGSLPAPTGSVQPPSPSPSSTPAAADNASGGPRATTQEINAQGRFGLPAWAIALVVAVVAAAGAGGYSFWLRSRRQ